MAKKKRGAREVEPPPATTREETKQRTREALITAALELFAEDGLDTPSLDAICDRAGYTRGAFYVHFADRDALLVAVMEKVGEAVLAGVFEQLGQVATAERRPDASLLAVAAQRFVGAIASGAYPLMAPPAHAAKGRGTGATGPQIRFHQLLDACARSPVVRDRYRGLLEASIARLAELARADQAAGAIARASDPVQIGTLLLAVVLGAQTMAEIGLPIDPQALTTTVFGALRT